MKLSQIAAPDTLTASMVGLITQRSTLLRNHIEFYKGPGNGGTERKENKDGEGIQTWVIGNGYAPKTLTPTYFSIGRKIFGDTARIDVAYERMGFDIGSEMLSQLKTFATPMANTFHNLLINGDATNNAAQFNGLKALCTSAQTITADKNGLTVLMGSDNNAKISQQMFLEALDNLLVKVAGMKVLLLGGLALARLNTIAREWLTYTKDTFGNPITLYNGIQLINVEELSGAGGIIPQTETVGTNQKCSSIYAVSFGEREGLSFFTTQDGFMVYPIQKEANFYKASMELITDSALFNEKSVARLQGLVFG